MAGCWALQLSQTTNYKLYDVFRSWLPRTDDGKAPPLSTLIAGAAAGALAHTLTYPLDTVRRRMQISGVNGAATYRSASQCAPCPFGVSSTCHSAFPANGPYKELCARQVFAAGGKYRRHRRVVLWAAANHHTLRPQSGYTGDTVQSLPALLTFQSTPSIVTLPCA